MTVTEVHAGPAIMTAYYDAAKGGNLTFELVSVSGDDTIERFEVWYGSELLDRGKDYELSYGKDGGFNLILSETYMKTLPKGTHRFRIETGSRTVYVDVVVAVKPM